MVIGIGDVIAVFQLAKEWLTWKELDPLQVSSNWPDKAKVQGIIPADQVYVWSDPFKAEDRILDETHQWVWLVNKLNRTRQKVVTKDGLTLMVKLS